MPAKTTAVIVGAGHRAIVYASYAKSQPDELEIVGVADPSPLRRELMTQMFDLRPDRCFETAEVCPHQLQKKALFALVVIKNGPFSYAGYF